MSIEQLQQELAESRRAVAELADNLVTQINDYHEMMALGQEMFAELVVRVCDPGAPAELADIMQLRSKYKIFLKTCHARAPHAGES